MKIAKSLKNLIVPFVFSGFLLGSPLYSQTADFQKNLTEKFSTNLEKRIFNENPLSNEKRDKYAILISGDSDPKYEQNLFLAYKTFMNNGFKQKNIYVLGSSGKYSSMYPVDSPASKKSIKTLFEYLSKKVDSEDLIFVYTTGHGDISKFNGKNEATLTFSDQENFSAQEFIDNLKKINPKEGILFSDQCYGGSFAKLANEIGYVGISASKEDKESWWNTFPQSFFRAWKEKSADKDGDGKLSLKEIFDYAVIHDFLSMGTLQEPQIFSNKDANQIFLKEKF